MNEVGVIPPVNISVPTDSDKFWIVMLVADVDVPELEYVKIGKTIKDALAWKL